MKPKTYKIRAIEISEIPRKCSRRVSPWGALYDESRLRMERMPRGEALAVSVETPDEAIRAASSLNTRFRENGEALHATCRKAAPATVFIVHRNGNGHKSDPED